MLRVALTGGIATGKSYCLEQFERLGARTIDADVLARDAVAKDSDGLKAVVRRFGGGVMTPDGDLDREALGRIVFEDPAARHDLEAIIHPVVYGAISRWFEWLDANERSGTHTDTIGIADIPLLFETGHQTDFDAVIVAACRRDQQIERLMARGLTRTDAEHRLAAQLPIEEKTRGAEFVIDTSGPYPDTDARIKQVWRALSARAAAPR
jgi:dephospho-CoA kinase